MSAHVSPCHAFFEQHAQSSDKAGPLHASGCALDWEKMSASRYSPGPIQDAESVIRLVINPIHVDLVDGSIRPSLLSDIKDKGGSINRLAHTTREAAISAGEAWQQQKNAAAAPTSPPRSVYGTITLSVEKVRGILTGSGQRAFAVFDTAKIDDPSHGDVFLVQRGTTQEFRSARLQLFDLATSAFQPA